MSYPLDTQCFIAEDTEQISIKFGNSSLYQFTEFDVMHRPSCNPYVTWIKSNFALKVTKSNENYG
jgi:hypothetical protein